MPRLCHIYPRTGPDVPLPCRVTTDPYAELGRHADVIRQHNVHTGIPRHG